MDEVEQDTSGFLPLVGITEVSRFQNNFQLDKCMLLLNRHSCQKLVYTFLVLDLRIHGSCFDGYMDGALQKRFRME